MFTNLLTFFRGWDTFSPEFEELESLRKTGSVTEETKETNDYVQKSFKYVSNDGNSTIFRTTTEAKIPKLTEKLFLKKQLRAAVEEEDFEHAIQLREKLKELK